ncbi:MULTISPECIES: helix-turn-helix domain-containing protein [Fructobacillus]|uniref:XRE-family HTH domain (XRE) n=1 Tax=Fructobacillus evanidus TaxID=3064281 RepID=A0ABM9MRT0_9LACO|nr:DNA-binding transcriptional regulator [Fructobacillus sp. LMG 32999]CAK1247211.1 DNA-binding transcriptional regulator [Fructobacillus tropaeoli]CAK1235088.1 DNA-binding transcriptional regulator [Fructobacillus sp. LMG 32999]CAK1235523.1 DNA-binding transcriptional regulator [Fructobacillus sp. LMG 32999]CAK1235966.1 DNA-binding transcriptional regulator [Fructobacillus sp. LMG 32999]
MEQNRIKQLRQEQKISLTKLASIVGISQPTLSRYESGYIKNGKHEVWQKLADFFGVPVGYVQGVSEYKSPFNNVFSAHNENIEVPTINEQELSNIIDYKNNIGNEEFNKEWQSRQTDIKSNNVGPILDLVSKIESSNLEENIDYNQSITKSDLRSLVLDIITDIVLLADEDRLQILLDIRNLTKEQILNTIKATHKANNNLPTDGRNGIPK